ncbi:MAG: 2-oxoglutarate dehydrogenase complex dihydrolipoyllysine-residue succinyltransferase [Saprospiraceae bacterium]|nr:2-oxoglutarate dehydrogenase complex dihydrolipoyllysine-residue succinyltransferase [Saprospiraceae bacterium]
MSLIELHVPPVGESITEVTLSKWLKPNGSFVRMDESLCEFESDKATLEFPSEASGKLIHVAAEGDDLEIGALIAKLDTSVKEDAAAPDKSTTPADPSSPAKTEEVTPASSSYAEGHPSPAAAKMMREKGLSSSDVTGTGKGGRITREDAASANVPSSAPKETSEKPAAKAVASLAFSREEHREKMTRMRRTIAKRLVSAKNNTAMLTTFNEVDLSAVFDLRKRHQEAFVKKYGIKLGFMSLFAKACALALKDMPEVNARIDGDDFIYHDYADISIAISTPTGLVVPPVHNVESLALHEIEWAIKDLAEKARTGKLTLEEMSGGTFTITNGGVFGSMMSTPIINEPQSAILGMHAIKERPVVVDGQIVIRPMMYLALSYDHRVIDGSSSVTFLVKVKELLEDPVRFILGL